MQSEQPMTAIELFAGLGGIVAALVLYALASYVWFLITEARKDRKARTERMAIYIRMIRKADENDKRLEIERQQRQALADDYSNEKGPERASGP